MKLIIMLLSIILITSCASKQLTKEELLESRESIKRKN